MATFYADNAANAVAVPPVKTKVNKQHGRLRYMEATYTAPASGTPQVGDVIQWGRVPVGARVVQHLSTLVWSVGTASSTINLGDAAAAARYLGATSIATAGNALVGSPANGAASFEVSDGSGKATDNSMVQSVVAGAAVAANQVITLRLAYVLD